MGRGELRVAIRDSLETYEADVGVLPGIVGDAERDSLVEQIVESVRRTEFFFRVRDRDIDLSSCDPHSRAFDPIRAAVYYSREAERNEAFWMVFLFVHFGKSRASKWALAADIYGGLSGTDRWTWDRTSSDVAGFRQWLVDNVHEIRAKPGRSFGNHRKFETLEPSSASGTGVVVESYVRWVGPDADHDLKLERTLKGELGPTENFDVLYRSIKGQVARFGRLAAFDYCATLGRLGLADIEPGMACLVGSTGPLKGANLLLTGVSDVRGGRALEDRLAALQAHLGVGFDVLEDSLCNWQKSPSKFISFRG